MIKVVSLCGSMKFADDMINIATNLEKKYGWCVLQCVYNVGNVNEQELDNIVQAHYKRIDISDAIYVVNIGGYIGNSVKNEIKYALDHGKEVINHEKI